MFIANKNGGGGGGGWTLSHYDAAAVKNAAVFKMLICATEMHSSEPIAYCSQQRCISASPAPRVSSSRLMFPSAADSSAELLYLNFKHSVK